ncbi:LytR C-terminal domain-containing protein [Arthrobacter sp. AL08]|uniref:LytR C-terminal domain-containing protein n=1 Tax=unclassified Arthrobacter TaxID=235627 RepID=UPI002499F72B|nr:MULTISPECIES: LytR C-terminal domain-containing protein [unclassified Arthrobacter]MDI3242976.1 LytR C-terminal domain-containing protein [Arthrobacter sp. AL05]MDI3278954.1 LytR C-terminal domain-containing protein [Arthrobacter sp. AL08]
MTKYARDEFDRVPETSARQGVHRTVAESRHRRRLGPILGAGAAALAIGLVAFIFLPKIGFSSAADSTQAAVGQSGSSAAASAVPAATAASSEAPSSPPASESPAATPAATTPAAAIDKTQPVAIFNGTATAGLANRVGGTVSTAGWTVGALGNWGGLPQQRSVVFYNGVGQKDNAEALGQLLGIPSVVDSAEFQLPLVVVLAPGFA